MKNISLKENEVSELILFYEQELEKAQERTQTLKNMLTKLKGERSSAQLNEGKKKKPKKLPKLDLTGFIKDILKEKNEVLVVSDLVELALKKFNLDLQNTQKKQFTANVSATLFRLTKSGEINKFPIKDKKRGFWYGLIQWFDPNGQLKEPYKLKVK